MTVRPKVQPPISAFTLIELLMALAISSLVLAVISRVYFSALQLNNRTEAVFDRSLPIQHALRIIHSDLGGLMLPGGALSGELKSNPGTDSSTTLFNGVKVSPDFYSNSAIVDDSSPFSEVQKVSYYLATPTNYSTGQDLMRVTSRNLLPVGVDESISQLLLENVAEIQFQYYDGTTWQNQWDSTVSSNLPTAIKFGIVLAGADEVLNRQAPIELVVPVTVEALTNVVAATGEETP